MSGSGKASVLKAFEDLGYYCVDNLPVELIPRFAEMALQSAEIRRTALVVDVREGSKLEQLPGILKAVRRTIPTKVAFLEASDAVLLRRFSETRRPHPLGTDTPVNTSIKAERRHLASIRALADIVIDTSKFNVHELRAHITERFREQATEKSILVSCVSFGFRHGVPEEADLVFDVRFLPNPHFRSGIPAAYGASSERGQVHPVVSADPGVHSAHFRSAGLSSAALYSRRQELFDDQFWLHRGPAPFRDDRRGSGEAPAQSRIPREGCASGYAEVG